MMSDYSGERGSPCLVFSLMAITQASVISYDATYMFFIDAIRQVMEIFIYSQFTEKIYHELRLSFFFVKYFS